MYPLQGLHEKFFFTSCEKQLARDQDKPGPSIHAKVNFDYYKFEWFRIPKLFFLYIKELYKIDFCLLPECASLHDKQKHEHFERHLEERCDYKDIKAVQDLYEIYTKRNLSSTQLEIYKNPLKRVYKNLYYIRHLQEPNTQEVKEFLVTPSTPVHKKHNTFVCNIYI